MEGKRKSFLLRGSRLRNVYKTKQNFEKSTFSNIAVKIVPVKSLQWILKIVGERTARQDIHMVSQSGIMTPSLTRKEQNDFLREKSGWYHLSPVTSNQSHQRWDTFVSRTLEAEKTTKSRFCSFYRKVEHLNLNLRKHQINPNGDQIFYKTTD